MSSILKALKKLEHEKTGRFPESLNISSDILRPNEAHQSFSPLTILLFSLIIFGGGAAATFLFLNNDITPKAINKSQQVIRTENDHTTDSLPAGITETLPHEIEVVPAKSRPGEERHTAQHKTVLEVNSAANNRSTKVEETKTIKQETTAAVSSEHVAAARTAPVLRVNGIAFQNRGAESVAIVNGIAVTREAVIEGATVVDVRNDRVLFKYNGEPFEILLGQSNK
ncbi:MAG: hypothetical protein PHP95_07875 [Desulfuromonadaceae bacterium]|nr:hypothetical protein [Desulfuromonadaceae bacterium]MDD2848359.1 hypothetical protein [Desulfuromonadaceae bacterium]MDD4129245.1 hypothetical protein [Desulfuromonadaceae bacterium]